MGILDLFKPDVRKSESQKNVPGLLKALRYKSDVTVREDAIRALVPILDKNPDASATEALIEALQDSSEYVREQAAEILKNFPSERVVDALIQSLNHLTYGTSNTAIKSLSIIGNSKAIRHLLFLLQRNTHYDVPVGIALRRFNHIDSFYNYLLLLSRLRYNQVKKDQYTFLTSDHDHRECLQKISPSLYIQVLNSDNDAVLIEGLNHMVYGPHADLGVIRRVIQILNDHRSKDVQFAAKDALYHVKSSEGLKEIATCEDNALNVWANNELQKIAASEAEEKV
jgi:hypothetical protein